MVEDINIGRIWGGWWIIDCGDSDFGGFGVKLRVGLEKERW